MVLNNKLFHASVIFLVGLTFLSAQQDTQYTQYMYNTTSINPGYAGSRGLASATLTYRSQWVGLEGAPETLYFSLNSPMGYSGVGGGISFFSDRIGPADESSLALDFSYTIRVGPQSKLSFGLKGGVNLLNVDFTELDLMDSGDPSFQNNIDNRLSPLVGAGLYLHSDRWYVGLSSPNFIESDHFDDTRVSTASEKANFYFISGYVFDLNRDIKFKPAILSKLVSGAPLSLDVSANFLFYDKFVLGGAYRLDSDVSFLGAFNISDNILIGYGYDFDTSSLRDYNSGSHEIFIRFELLTRVRRVFNPRFF